MFCNKCGDPIEVNEKYCSKCGNSLETNSTIIQDNSISKRINNKSIIIGLIIGIILIIPIFYFGTKTRQYYYNKDSNETKEDSIKTAENKYSTKIVATNQYFNANIYNDNDAIKLIVKDSTDQKNNCPSEILKVENNIINKYGITAVNLCEMDVEFAKGLEEALNYIYDEYQVFDILTNLTLINQSMSNMGITAAFLPFYFFASTTDDFNSTAVIKTQIFLSSSYFLNLPKFESTIEASVNSGHWPQNTTPYSVVVHEFGHYLSYLSTLNYYNIDKALFVTPDFLNNTLYFALRKYSSGEHSLIILQEAYNNCIKDTNVVLSFDEWRNTISDYAVAKDNNGNYIYDETIAESVADVYLNGNNAAAASRYINETLKKYLES